jgi:23S rRNA pseudouridine1911/1915/1917 synthase
VTLKLPGILMFENEDMVVLNKPSGLLSIPDREDSEISLKKILKEKYGEIYTVHRLDKETSGVMVFAKNPAAHRLLSQQFEERDVEKIYLGLVSGSPQQGAGTIDAPIMESPSKRGLMVVHKKGKPSKTEYEVLEDFGIYAWLRLKIHTGRTHQLRVHMKHIGHPIACDGLYGDARPLLLSTIKHNFKLSKNEEVERPLLNRLALHSHQLTFKGADGTDYSFEAPIPKDLRAVLNQLTKRRAFRKTET